MQQQAENNRPAQEQDPGSHDSAYPQSQDHHNHTPYTIGSPPTANLHPHQREEGTVSNSHETKHQPHTNSNDLGKKLLTSERSPTKYAHTWQATQSAQHEVADEDLVNIQHLVEYISSNSSNGDPVIPLIEISDVDDPESILRIGRWGEEFVSAVLRRRGELPNGRKIKDIQWVNETAETGKPYDIEVELEASEDNDDNTRIYIEVKSTSSSKKDLVNFSWSELKFAEEKCGDYHLYRVYNAGRDSHRLCQLEDLSQYLQSKPIRLFFIL